MDAQEIIDKVQSGNSPSYWQIYHGRNLYPPALFLVSMVAAPLLLCSGSELFSQYMNIYVLMFFGIPALICLLACWVMIWSAKQYKKSILIIMPEGVVMGRREVQISWLQFAGIKALGLMSETEISGGSTGVSTTTEYWLDVYGWDGSYHAWVPGGEFGNQATMCKRIIAAYQL